MKSNILSLLVFSAIFTYTTTTQAQVGIGTSSPNASAQLEVSSTSKGFLPPRVALTGTADATTIASPATGLMVYNTATAGTSPNNVTPGIYYYDGAKWQRVINQQPDATVEFDKATPTTAGVVFTPNTPASKDYVYVSTVDNSQWTYNGSAYVTYTPPASTPWMLSGGTNDAGSNKSSAIYRSGNVGIGTGSTAPVERLQIGTAFAFHDGGDKVIGLGVNPSTFKSLLTSQWPAEIRLDPSTGSLQFGTTSNGSAPALGGAATLTRRMTIARSGNVGIGTTSPNASAILDLASTTQGFLPPSMTSTQRNAITSPASGLVVYNSTDNSLDMRQNATWRSIATLDGTETLTNKTISGSSNTISNVSLTSGVTGTLPVANGGTGATTSTGTGSVVLSTSPTLTTPTIASGSSQWATSLQINPTTHGTSQRASVWIDGWSLLQDVNGTGTKDFSIGQTVPGSPTTYPSRFFINTSGNIGVGNVTPSARVDIRTSPTSTTDPGAGYLGIGTTSTAANTAGAGAVRYNTGNGGVLEYSNGSIWQPLAASKAVPVYTEVHSDATNSSSYSSGSAFNDFNTITADNVVSVYGSSYGFFNGSGTGSSSDKWVAPFTGKYRITTNAYFNYNAGYSNPRLYAYKNNSTICNITSASNSGQDIATSTSAIIQMNQGDYINWKVEGSGAQIWRGLYHTFFRIESVE